MKVLRCLVAFLGFWTAAAGLPVRADFVFHSQFGSPGASTGQFNEPAGIGADGNGNVFVSDSHNGRVQKFTNNGTFLTSFSIGGITNGLAVDAGGNVYVADDSNRRIAIFSNNGTFLRNFSASSTYNAGGSFLTEGAGGVAVDASGNIYASFTERIKKFDSAGQLLGTIEIGFPVGGVEQKQVQSVAVDSNGNIFAAYIPAFSGIGKILKFDSGFHELTSWNTSAVPRLISVDSSGNVFVPNSDGSVQEFNNNGTLLTSFGGYAGSSTNQPGLWTFGSNGPNGVAVDANERAFVTDVGGKVVEFDGPSPQGPSSPEPASLTLCAVAGLGSAAWHWRKRRLKRAQAPA